MRNMIHILETVSAAGNVIERRPLPVIFDDEDQAEEAEHDLQQDERDDPRESAILSTLVSGNYTAIVRGKGDATGVGLVEVYNLP